MIAIKKEQLFKGKIEQKLVERKREEQRRGKSLNVML